ncbi:plasma membrane ascorbate-dependent reductase CYBRD1 isoform X2 [Halyomorpha halys]
MATAPAKEAGEPLPTSPTDQEKDNKIRKTMEEDLKSFNILFGITNGVGLLCVVLVLVWTSHYAGGFAWRSDPPKQFNWHPLLMTVGMIYLFANSIMIYRALRTMRKQKLKLVHAGIHSVVILCIIIAQVAVFDFHNLSNIPNLYTLHSWIGLLTVIIYFAQWAMSLVVFLYPGVPLSVRATIMPWHVFLGLFAFIMAIATSLSGLLEKAIFKIKNYGELPGEAVLMNTIGLFFVLFAVLVVYLTTEPKFKRHPRPEDGALLSTSPNE